MFCANPDKIIMRQNGKKIFCAGAIANIYENLGGIVKSLENLIMYFLKL